jgi:hypothetical protein
MQKLLSPSQTAKKSSAETSTTPKFNDRSQASFMQISCLCMSEVMASCTLALYHALFLTVN